MPLPQLGALREESLLLVCIFSSETGIHYELVKWIWCRGNLIQCFVFVLFGWTLIINSKHSRRKCSFQIKISSIPKDRDHLEKSGDEFLILPGYVILWWKKEEMRLLCTVVNCACGTEKPSENNNYLGGNGEVFERSEGIFFSFFLHALEIKWYRPFSFFTQAFKIFFW